jgi:Protein of unknown function (DUF2652)
MSQSRALLLIADIGGYTQYMSLHRVSLAHAQANVARLLEAVLDAADGLELVEIEGDAVFLSGPAEDNAAEAVTGAAVAMHRAFHEEQRRILRNLCPCAGCDRAGELTLKFVAHVGAVAEQRLRDRTTLVGPDVILVHRLLKNSVPVPEYVLYAADLYRGEDGVPLVLELEGLGPVEARFVDLAQYAEALSPVPVRLPARVGETLSVLGRGVPYLLGLKREPAPA